MSDRFVYGYRVQVAARQVRSNSLPDPISSPGGDGAGWATGWSARLVAPQVFMWALTGQAAYVPRNTNGDGC